MALIVMLGVVVGLLAVLFVGLLRSHAQVLRALHAAGIRVDADHPEGFRLSAPSPDPMEGLARAEVPDVRPSSVQDVTGVTPDGAMARMAVSGVSHHTLLVFLSTGCGACVGLWDEMGASSAAVQAAAGSARILVVTQGAEVESPGAVARLAPPGVDVVMSTEAWEDYGVGGAPYFVLIDGRAGRVLGEGSAGAWHQVADLLSRAVADARVEGRTRRDLLTGGAGGSTGRGNRADRRLGGEGET